MSQRYDIIEKIATGGMAEIHRARVLGAGGFEKQVVVKQILPNFTRDPDFVRMFIEEAKLAAGLQHGNIVQVYDLGVSAEGDYFIVMEYVQGHDLGDVLNDARRRNLQLSIAEVMLIAQQVCAALDYAHRKCGADGAPLGLIHRDVSPQNVLLSFEGEVKLTDFGIAKARTRTQETQAGFLRGKYGYMSPEQARGEVLTQASDLFNVGILLFEMLSGERLFQGSNDFSTLNQMRSVEMTPLEHLRPDLPDALQSIVRRALAEDLDERFKNAAQLDQSLSRFAYVMGCMATPAQLSETLATLYGIAGPPPDHSPGTRVLDLRALPGERSFPSDVASLQGEAGGLASWASGGSDGGAQRSESGVVAGAKRTAGQARGRPATVSLGALRALPDPKPEHTLTGLYNLVPPLPRWAKGGATVVSFLAAVLLALLLVWPWGARRSALETPTFPMSREAAEGPDRRVTEPISMLVIQSEPTDARVELDGTQVSLRTPVMIPLAGEAHHRLALHREGYRTWTGAVAPTADHGVSVVTPSLTYRRRRLRLSSSPSRATLTLDGQAVGRTPTTLDLKTPGTHSLIATRRGRQPARLDLGEASKGSVKLWLPTPKDAVHLRVLTWPTATLRVAGRVLNTGTKGVDLVIPPGHVEAEFLAPPLAPQTLSLNFGPGEHPRLFVDLLLRSSR